MEHDAFIRDPGHLATLEAQRYVVLRPSPDLCHVLADVQASVRVRIGGFPAWYPALAHVTLAGFPAGTSLEAVQDLVTDWAATVPPLQLEVERVGVFPAPFQVVFVQVRKTRELFNAFVSLRRRANDRGLPEGSETSPEREADWVFHMTVAHCPTMSAEAFGEVAHFIDGLRVPAATGVVHAAEIVAVDDGREHSGGVFALTSAARH